MATNRHNETVYGIVRANLLASVKDSYFIDRPNYVVRKIDQLFCHMHCFGHQEFLEALEILLKEMKKDFDYEITEYNNLTRTVDSLLIYVANKLKGEDI